MVQLHKSKTILTFRIICLTSLIFFTPLMSLHSQTNPVSGQITTNKFYSTLGKWIKASNTNSLVWDSFPREGESVTWSGGIVDGKANGKGIVQWFTNGTPSTSYEGEMKNGLADGHGIAESHDYTTEGDFENGRLVSKNIIIHYSTGGWYKGENRDGFKEGQGEEMMNGDIKYVGHFKQDRFDGLGIMIWPNGDKITGNWKDSKLVGVGTYTQSGGESFKVKMTDKGIERF
jgi:hypothetical protein